MASLVLTHHVPKVDGPWTETETTEAAVLFGTQVRQSDAADDKARM